MSDAVLTGWERPAAPVSRLSGLPLIGPMLTLKRDPLNMLTRLSNSGDDIIRWTQAGKEVVLVNHPEGIRQVLMSDHKKYHKGVFYAKVKPLFGRGMPVLEGQDWKRHRQLAQPSFRRDMIDRIAHLSLAASHRLLQRWQTQDGVFDATEDLGRLTLEVVATALFGADVEEHAEAVGQAIDDMLAISETRVWSFPDPHGLPISPLFWKFRRARHALDRMIFDFIRQRRETGPRDDLLTALMMAAEQHKMDDIELRDEITSLIVTGHESTANILAWSMYELSRHPEVLDNVRAELHARLGIADPTPEQLDELPYTRAVLAEVMRLYPATWTIARTPIEDTEIMGQPVKAGCNVMVSPYLMHRHRRYWRNPETFDPLRFIDGHVDELPRCTYFPFGAGPRGCVGEAFAMKEMLCVLTTLLRSVEVELAPGQNVTKLPRISVRPADGLWITSRPLAA